MEVHVINKLDNNQHTTIQLPQDAGLGKLAESSVRVRTQLISLSSNNLTYAEMGTMLHWWDTYPVQPFYPPPYNDSSKWGIVPAWGFVKVIESTIPALPVDTVLLGFCPTSNAPTDLKLELSEASGHWIEVSEHRSSLMPLYSRYTIAGALDFDSATEDERDRWAWSTVYRALWKAGNHLDEYVFPSDIENKEPIHPFGAVGLPWTKEDGDLTSAVMVSLGASTKTGRAFAYFFERRQGNGPLGLLQVTSAVAGLSQATEAASPVFPSMSVDYKQSASSETTDWLLQRSPAKIVILDFGCRPGGLDGVLDLIKRDPTLGKAKVVIIGIGTEQKIRSKEEAIAAQKEVVALGKLRYNTSGVQDAAVIAKGEKDFFESLNSKWDRMIEERHQWAPDLKIVQGNGISGIDGLEGGWTKLSKGEVAADEALVYRV